MITEERFMVKYTCCPDRRPKRALTKGVILRIYAIY